MKYIVLEIQTDVNDNVATIINSYSTREAAESRYHEVLMYAALSALPVHSAALIDNNGMFIKNERFIHDTDRGGQEE